MDQGIKGDSVVSEIQKTHFADPYTLDRLTQLENEATDLRRQLDAVPSDIRAATSQLRQQAGQLAELRSQLEEVRALLRSACSIAERKGKNAAWGRFLSSAEKLGVNGITVRTYKLLDHEKEDER
jgi:septal ring factor EnvC (AmiA/AmiB activator)